MNKLWEETCTSLMKNLMVMCCISATGVVGCVYISYLKKCSDTQWISVIAVCCVGILGFAIFGYWTIYEIFQESGIGGVYQCTQCMDGSTCGDQNLCDPFQWKLIQSPSEC